MITELIDKVKPAVEKVEAARAEYEEIANAVKDELSAEFGITVLSIKTSSTNSEIHVFETEWVAALPGASWLRRIDNYFPWQVQAEVEDNVVMFAISHTGPKEEQTDDSE